MTEFRVPLDSDDGNGQNNPWTTDETSDWTTAEAYAARLLTRVSRLDPGVIDFKPPAAGDAESGHIGFPVMDGSSAQTSTAAPVGSGSRRLIDAGGTAAPTSSSSVLPSGVTAVTATTAGAALISSAVVTGSATAAPIASSSGGSATTEGYGAAGGLVFNVTYDASANSAPAGFKTAFAAAIEFYTTEFSDPITINIDVGWGEVDGIPLSAGNLGESFSFLNIFSYSQVRSALQADATSVDDQRAVASLPGRDPTGGGNFLVTKGEQKAPGLLGASNAVDGYVGFGANDIFSYDPGNRRVPERVRGRSDGTESWVPISREADNRGSVLNRPFDLPFSPSPSPPPRAACVRSALYWGRG
jgi:hypothetical protein